METNTSVALLGLGTMGSGMAQNLLKAGFHLAVYNRTRSKAEALASQGAIVADSPRDAVRNATVAISMLADDAASRAAWIGPDGALESMPAGSTIVECSTVSPEWIAELDSRAKARGLGLIEAPVTGSRVQAETGQLTFLAAGEKETLDAVRPVLQSMSKEVLHLGPIGCGAQLKLINNFLCAVQVVSFAEALAWIERSNLNRDTALDFLKTGAPGSAIFKTMAERMTRREYDVNFLLRLMKKDLRYAQAAASGCGVTLTTAQPTEAMFQAAEQQGYGEKDMSAVVEVPRKQKACSLHPRIRLRSSGSSPQQLQRKKLRPESSQT